MGDRVKGLCTSKRDASVGPYQSAWFMSLSVSLLYNIFFTDASVQNYTQQKVNLLSSGKINSKGHLSLRLISL